MKRFWFILVVCLCGAGQFGILVWFFMEFLRRGSVTVSELNPVIAGIEFGMAATLSAMCWVVVYRLFKSLENGHCALCGKPLKILSRSLGKAGIFHPFSPFKGQG